MVEINAKHINWINNNLSTTIDMLSQEEVREWEALLKRDEKQFFTEAILGFVARQRQLHPHKKEVSNREIMTFCKQFLTKIEMAASGLCSQSLRLFEISDEVAA